MGKRVYRRRKVDLNLSAPIGPVEVGEHDVMSAAARKAQVPLCGQQHPGDETKLCTRAAGHDEGDGKRGHSSTHVFALVSTFIVMAMWR